MAKQSIGATLVLAASLCCSPLAAVEANDAGARNGLVAHCASVHDDDKLRNYESTLREPKIKASRTIFAASKEEPDASQFEAQAQYRCMDGRVMVCFTGANLPCTKINTAKDNPGANVFCRQASDGVPVAAYAAGHDSAFSFTCRAGKAVVDRETWKLDKRGFATKLWTALPSQ